MFEYHDELQRRIEQFASYLKKMYRRSHVEVQDDCFMIFKDYPPTGGFGTPSLTEAAKPPVELVLSGFADAGVFGGTLSDDIPSFDLPDERWKQDNSQRRFIQFAFERKSFYMELPIQTLYRAEAEQILRSRKGFFFLRDRRPDSRLLEDFEPFQKVYIYGDEDSAAEDMAFVFFHVWMFPVDSRFYVTAKSFGRYSRDWENGVPIE